MMTINQKQIRKELIRIYEIYLNKGKKPIKKKIENFYNKYHNPADYELLDKDLCRAIQNLYSLAWPQIARISKTKKTSKDEMKKIFLELKKKE